MNDNITPTTIRPSEVDKLLIDEIKSLSFQHRSTIQEEIHGARTLDVEETPELLSRSVLSLSTEIGRMVRMTTSNSGNQINLISVEAREHGLCLFPDDILKTAHVRLGFGTFGLGYKLAP